MLQHRIRVKRRPLSGTVCFQSCNLCYTGVNCCPHISSCCHPIIIPSDYVYWSKVLIQIQQYQDNNDTIRIITERSLPNEVIWAAVYSEKNVLQANINLFQDWEQIKWAIALAHKAEKCGVECVLVVYPILPLQTKLSQVIQILDAINTCKHCKVMIRFGEFINYGLPIHSGFIKLRGCDIPLSLVNRIKGDLWGCTDDFKSQFMKYLRFYADVSNIDVQVCEVIR